MVALVITLAVLAAALVGIWLVARWVGAQAEDRLPEDERDQGKLTIRGIWAALAAVVVIFLFASSLWCEEQPFETENCAEKQGRKAGIALVVGLAGFFLLWAIETSWRGRRDDPPSGDGGERIESLRKLAELRDSGALSEEEFQQEKARILRE